MKYNVWEFSQAEITKLNDINPKNKLDLTDLLILQWFKDFVAYTHAAHLNKNKKGMWTKYFEDNEYYYVNYKSLVDEFPMIDITSERAIGRRFDKYVELGLMIKKVFHCGQKGAFPFFNVTENFFALIYNEADETQKINPHNNDSTLDSKVQCNDSTLDSKVQCFKHNTTIKNLNPTTTAYNNTKQTYATEIVVNKNRDLPDMQKAAVDFKLILKKLFKINVLPFSDNFYFELYKGLEENNIYREEYGVYLKWAYEECCNHKPNDIFDYFFKTVSKKYFIVKYKCKKDTEPKSAPEKLKMKCPVCETLVENYGDCPCCNLPAMSFNNLEEINNYRILFNLPVNYRKECQKELDNIIFDLNNLSTYKNHKQAIYKKYEIYTRK